MKNPTRYADVIRAGVIDTSNYDKLPFEWTRVVLSENPEYTERFLDGWPEHVHHVGTLNGVLIGIIVEDADYNGRPQLCAHYYLGEGEGAINFETDNMDGAQQFCEDTIREFCAVFGLANMLRLYVPVGE